VPGNASFHGWRARSVDGPAFQSVWEARAFAIVVRLSETGCFTWAEWVGCLASQIEASAAAERAGGWARSDAEVWIDAAEALLIRKGITSAEQLRAKRLAAWPIDVPHGSVKSSSQSKDPPHIP